MLQLVLGLVQYMTSDVLVHKHQVSLPYIKLLLASERSERDTYRGNTIENRGCLFIYLFIYMFGRMYVILNFDPRIFVLVMWSTPSQIALNRILWFIDQYPYHPRK